MPTLITRDYVVSKKRGYSAGTFYASLIGSLENEPAREDAAMLMKRSGKMSKMRVYITDGGDPQQTASVTLQKKPSGGFWQDTDLTISNEDGSTGMFQTGDEEAAFSAGDLLCLKISSTQPSGTPFGLRFIALRIRDQ